MNAPTVSDCVAVIELYRSAERVRLDQNGVRLTELALKRLLDIFEVDELMDKRGVDVLYLTTRVRKRLRAAGIRTVGQLCELTEVDILVMRDLGRTSLRCVCDALAEVGKSLKGAKESGRIV